jgi:cysteine dioxygenase
MITDINELINEFENNYNYTNILNYKNIIEKYIGDDWKKYIVDSNEPFNKNKIYVSDNFEIVLISWEKDYITPLHKHPKNGCILKILDGMLSETIINDDKIKNNIYLTNNISYMHDIMGLHKIKALEKTYSLHIYSPPNFYN